MNDPEYEARAALRCDECLATAYLNGDLTVDSVTDAQHTEYTCDQDDCTYIVDKNMHRVN